MQEAIISLDNVNVYQQNNTLVLSNVNIKVEDSEFAYLIGRTGSGKSSLLKILYGELALKEGEGHIAGTNLRGLRRKDVPYLRRRLGIIFQDFQLMNDRSVQDNLLFVLKATDWKSKREMEKRCAEVLSLVGLSAKDYKKPHELSGGEQQRIVIARALLNNPKVILADEPTGNLDPDVSDDIMKLLHNISQSGTAILMATHDYRIINKFPGTIFQCANGTVKKTEYVG